MALELVGVWDVGKKHESDIDFYQHPEAQDYLKDQGLQLMYLHRLEFLTDGEHHWVVVFQYAAHPLHGKRFIAFQVYNGLGGRHGVAGQKRPWIEQITELPPAHLLNNVMTPVKAWNEDARFEVVLWKPPECPQCGR